MCRQSVNTRFCPITRLAIIQKKTFNRMNVLNIKLVGIRKLLVNRKSIHLGIHEKGKFTIHSRGRSTAGFIGLL